MILWHPITFLGDSIVTMPVAAALAVWLVTAGAWRMALTWCALFGSGLFLVLATKVAFIGWGLGIPELDFTGISGHAMRACAVYPAVAAVLLTHVRAPLRLAGVLAACALALLVSISRLVLHYHSPSEVVAGIGLGMLLATAFVRQFEGEPRLQLQRWVIGLTMLGLIPSAYAQPAPTQQWVTSVALYLSGHDRPYVRKPHARLVRENG